jgi:hypothetical protein
MVDISDAALAAGGAITTLRIAKRLQKQSEAVQKQSEARLLEKTLCAPFPSMAKS